MSVWQAAFWRGNTPNVIKIMPESAAKFFCYEYLKKKVVAQNNRESAAGNMCFEGPMCASSIVHSLVLFRDKEACAMRLKTHSAPHPPNPLRPGRSFVTPQTSRPALCQPLPAAYAYILRALCCHAPTQHSPNACLRSCATLWPRTPHTVAWLEKRKRI